MEFDDKGMVIRGFVTLHVPCRYSYLRIIRQSVMDLCARAGISEFKAAQMEMAVDEACANVIEHSYGGETDSENEPKHPGLRVNLMQSGDRIVVELLDHGKGFEFEQRDAINPEEYMQSRNQRGLGLYIIRSFVDDVTYERNTRAGNCLRLTKLIH
jgi:serine/threonine-protein kinase RsbW